MTSLAWLVKSIVEMIFPAFNQATRSITAPISGFRVALPGSGQSVPKPRPLSPRAERDSGSAIFAVAKWRIALRAFAGLPGYRAIVDAKYRPGRLENSDLFQIIGYARLVAPSGTLAGGACQGSGQPAAEAWLVVPIPEAPPGGLSVTSALDEFTVAWKRRPNTAACWPDGFKVGVVRVPLPSLPESAEELSINRGELK